MCGGGKSWWRTASDVSTAWLVVLSIFRAHKRWITRINNGESHWLVVLNLFCCPPMLGDDWLIQVDETQYFWDCLELSTRLDVWDSVCFLLSCASWKMIWCCHLSISYYMLLCFVFFVFYYPISYSTTLFRSRCYVRLCHVCYRNDDITDPIRSPAFLLHIAILCQTRLGWTLDEVVHVIAVLVFDFRSMCSCSCCNVATSCKHQIPTG